MDIQPTKNCGLFFCSHDIMIVGDDMGLLIEKDIVLKTLRRMSHEIIEKNEDLKEVILFGIMSKGYPLAKIIQENIKLYEGIDLDCHPLDISSYRDDEKKSNSVNPELNVDNKICILIDDVLYTGRTARAAMDALVDFGRPKKIQLGVLIDRGHRELPIRPDYVGKNVPTSREESILVQITGETPGVYINKKVDTL